MHRDMKLGLALGVLLVGIVGALFFRREPTFDTLLGPKLKNPSRLDERIADKPVGPYITGVETVDTRKSDNRQPLAAADKKPPLWEMPDFLKSSVDDHLADSRIAPDPIGWPSNRDSYGTAPVPAHNRAWTVTHSKIKDPQPDVVDLPAVDIEPPAIPFEETARTHVVKRGETLSGIASRYLGSGARFNDIWSVNRDIVDDPNHLTIGMKLRIPERSKRTSVPPSWRKATERKRDSVRDLRSGFRSLPPDNFSRPATRQSRPTTRQWGTIRAAPPQFDGPRATRPTRKSERFIPARSPFSSPRWGSRELLDPFDRRKRVLSQRPPDGLPEFD
jgi:hypothetical protein